MRLRVVDLFAGISYFRGPSPSLTTTATGLGTEQLRSSERKFVFAFEQLVERLRLGDIDIV